MTDRSHAFFLLVVIMIGSVSLIATDIYLPALPEMAVYFNCSQTEIQASFTVFLLGLALCQLTSGLLIDRFGQKKVALVGFSLFTIASLGCAYSNLLSQFIAFRLLQAIGGGVGSVIGRTIVVDRFNRKESVKIFSTTLPIIGLSSALAPLIGGYLTYYWSWRANFFFMVGFGVVLVFFAFFCLKNKKTIVYSEEQHLSTSSSIGRYFGLLRNVEYIGYVLILCAGFCVFRSYTVESPFVFHKQGYLADEMGHFYIALALAYLSGSLIAKRLSHKQQLEKILRVGIGFSLLGSFCMISLAALYGENPYAVIIPMSVIAVGNGFLFPISTAGAMTSIPTHLSGTASGLMGCIQFVLAAICMNSVGRVCQGEALPLSLFIGTLVIVGLCCYWFLILSRAKSTAVAN